MAPRGRDVLDSTCYSELQDLDSFQVGRYAHRPPSYFTPMATQRRVQLVHEPLNPHADLLQPFYLPPPQQLPALSIFDEEERDLTQTTYPTLQPFLPMYYLDPDRDHQLVARQPIPIPNNDLTARPTTPPCNFGFEAFQPINSTPIVQRISSKKLPGDDRRMYVPELSKSLEIELKSNIFQCISLVDNLYPSSSLPFPVDNSLLEALSAEDLWDSEHSVFKITPEKYNETSMSKWLNMLGQAIGRPHGKKRLRLWSSTCHNFSPSGSNTLRKPDLVLVDRITYQGVHALSKPKRIHWSDIRAIGEVTSAQRIPRRLYETVNQKSYLLFITQCVRRFVPALSFDGEGNFTLTVTDRQGQARMALMSLTASGTESALLILKILACLMYGSEGDVGIDPTMIRGIGNDVAAIYINQREFTVDRLIYRMQSLVGRGTQVWVVKHLSKSYILKDSWVQSGRVGSEIEFLNLMKDHKFLDGRIPHLFEGEDVNINGVLDSTARYRVDVGQTNYRVHRRLAMEPIGEPLIRFQTRAEFIQVIIEVVDVLNYLRYHVGVLHRDISPNNILLVRDATGNARCLLIDFDYAVRINSELKASRGLRTGTPPFMAIEIMLIDGKTFCHDLRHDLESVLYVIIWICTHMTGVESERGDVDDLDIRNWCGLEVGLRDLGLTKLAHISAAKISILAQLAPYWSLMSEFIQKLIKAFFPSGPAEPNEITPGKMLVILHEAKDIILACESKDKISSSASGAQGEASSTHLHYATLENGKRHRLGQEAVVASNKRGTNEIDTRLGGKVRRKMASWQESVLV